MAAVPLAWACDKEHPSDNQLIGYNSFRIAYLVGAPPLRAMAGDKLAGTVKMWESMGS
jgi:hypothetical protein